MIICVVALVVFGPLMMVLGSQFDYFAPVISTGGFVFAWAFLLSIAAFGANIYERTVTSGGMLSFTFTIMSSLLLGLTFASVFMSSAMELPAFAVSIIDLVFSAVITAVFHGYQSRRQRDS